MAKMLLGFILGAAMASLVFVLLDDVFDTEEVFPDALPELAESSRPGLSSPPSRAESARRDTLENPRAEAEPKGGPPATVSPPAEPVARTPEEALRQGRQRFLIFGIEAPRLPVSHGRVSSGSIRTRSRPTLQ